jgi:hypothetical protein
MYEYDNSYAFIALDKAQTLADLGGGVTGIEVKTADRWQAATVASRLVSALGWPYRTVDWEEQNHSLFQALKLEKLGMGVILLLIVLVAAFNIVSTLTTVVADKRSDRIPKAMGMLPGRFAGYFRAGPGHRSGGDGADLSSTALRSPSTNTSSMLTRGLFHRSPAGLDAADGCHGSSRKHRYRRDRNGVSVGAGFETLPIEAIRHE